MKPDLRRALCRQKADADDLVSWEWPPFFSHCPLESMTNLPHRRSFFNLRKPQTQPSPRLPHSLVLEPDLLQKLSGLFLRITTVAPGRCQLPRSVTGLTILFSIDSRSPGVFPTDIPRVLFTCFFYWDVSQVHSYTGWSSCLHKMGPKPLSNTKKTARGLLQRKLHISLGLPHPQVPCVVHKTQEPLSSSPPSPPALHRLSLWLCCVSASCHCYTGRW